MCWKSEEKFRCISKGKESLCSYWKKITVVVTERSAQLLRGMGSLELCKKSRKAYFLVESSARAKRDKTY
jgi:hypothetical protein